LGTEKTSLQKLAIKNSVHIPLRFTSFSPHTQKNGQEDKIFLKPESNKNSFKTKKSILTGKKDSIDHEHRMEYLRRSEIMHAKTP